MNSMSDSNIPRCAAIEPSQPERLLYTDKVITPSDDWCCQRDVAVLANALGVVGTMIHKLEDEVCTSNYTPSSWVASGEAFIILNALQQVKQALVERHIMDDTAFIVPSWHALLASPRLLWYGKVQTVDHQSDLTWENMGESWENQTYGLTYDVICPAYKILKTKIEIASLDYGVKVGLPTV